MGRREPEGAWRPVTVAVVLGQLRDRTSWLTGVRAQKGGCQMGRGRVELALPVIRVGMALALVAIVFGAACSATTGSAAPSTPQPFPGDVPYTFAFPEGWTYVTGDGAGWAAYLDEVGKTDPQEAERLADWVASWLTGEFGAVHVRAGDRMKPFVGCSQADTGGRPAADVLFSLEQENLDAIARAPNITTTPVSDHISLPLGETVRIRWEWEGDGGTEQAAVAYAFAADDMLMVCLFQSLPETVAAYEPEWEAIIGTFKPKDLPNSSPPPASPE